MKKLDKKYYVLPPCDFKNYKGKGLVISPIDKNSTPVIIDEPDEEIEVKNE